MITQSIKLNIVPEGISPIINVSQYDTGARTLEFNLYNGSNVFVPTDDTTAVLQGTKADGHIIQNSCKISGSKILVDCTEQMTAAEGDSKFEILLSDSTGQLATLTFVLRVKASALKHDAVDSATDLPYLKELEKTVVDAVNETKEIAGRPASTTELGSVKVDGTTITADEDGTIHGTATTPIATADAVGTVKPDGSTTTVDEDGTLHAKSIEAAIYKGTVATAVALNNAGNKSSGAYALAEGYGTTASGNLSHAEGQSTASGDFSHAEGFRSTASGNYSHAEGQSTASAYGAHAEGSSVARCQGGHAEGTDTTAGPETEDSMHQNCHAEGWASEATGNASHAEGYHGVASGDYSHAEGQSTASGQFSHAEGQGCESSGQYSHAEGQGTKALGQQCHSEGQQTIADGQYCHAEGYGSKTSGSTCHAEGYQTTASTAMSHAEGFMSTSSGAYSHAEGQQTTASNAASHAEGTSTKAAGYCSHAEGANTKASGSYSHAEGYFTEAVGESQHVFGEYNEVSEAAKNEDGTDNSAARSKYVEVVGNGYVETNTETHATVTHRTNARTLDWSGNEWLAGTLEAKGFILTSPDGSRWNVTIGNDGTLSTSKIS